MIKLIIDDNETKRSSARRNEIWLNKGSSVFLGCVFSTPYSIAYYIIRGGILRVAWYFYVLEGAMKNVGNEQNGCLYYMLNHRIMDLFSHYYFCFFNFTLRNTSYGPICASYRCFKEYAKDKNNTNENLSLKSSFLKNSSLKGKKKLKFGFFCAAFLLLFIFALFCILIQRRILRLHMTLFSKIT